jgi:parallel beta-helix repeat protein
VLTKTLTLRGGYNLTGFAWDPASHPTILNGRSQGSVLAIVGGGGAPTVEHLTLLGGQAAEGGGVRVIGAGPTLQNLRVMENTAAHGGGLYLAGCSSGSVLMSNTIQYNIAALGGGVYLHDSDIVLSKNTFADNRAQSRGGGLYLYQSAATLSENVVCGNDAPGGGSWDGGGGVYLWYSDAYLSNNTIRGNTTERYGAGIHLQDGSDAVLSGNMIVSNTAREYGDGGGVYLWDSAPTLDDNVIAGNIAENGGGLYLNFSSNRVTLKSNTIISNTADGWSGGGLYVHSPCTLINNVVADNYAEKRGSGVYVYDASPTLLHTTIARNTGGDGSGVYVTYDSVVTLTNTIVVDHAVGVTVTDDSTATLDSVLWFDNGIDIGGLGSYHVVDPFAGDPAFAADGYHLAGGSAAISAGTDSGVTDDVDGEPRPMGDGYELGADEVLAVFARSTDSDVMVYTDTQGLTTTIHIPPSAVTETTLFVYLPVLSPTHPFPSGVMYAGRAFDLDAYCYQWHYAYLPLVLRSYSSSSSSAVAGDAFIPASVSLGQRGAGCVSSPPGPIPCQPAFQTPVTITIHYSDADVAGLDESTLSLYHWTGSSWEDAVDTCTPASTYIRDTAGNVLQVAICHLSRWGMGGR